jgi:hypothetical protein
MTPTSLARSVAIFALSLAACGESLPPPKPSNVTTDAPPAEQEKAEPEAGEAATDGPEDHLARFVEAANRHDLAAVQKLVRPACWSSACQSFAGQAGQKFQVKQVGVPNRNADRATAVADIVEKGEVRDRVYLYLVKGTDGWVVVDIDEDESRSQTFLVEHEVLGNQSTPEETVKAYFNAAEARDKVQLLELFSEAGRKQEREWEKSFTNAIFGKGMKPKEWKLRDAKVEGDSATISARVVFTDAKGEDDNEGMNFTLKKQGEKWWIESVK